MTESTVAAFLRAEIERLQARADEIAHSTVGAMHTHDTYLVQVGRYRFVREQIDALEQKLRRGDEDDESDTPEGPPKPASRRRPRAWGGR